MQKDKSSDEKTRLKNHLNLWYICGSDDGELCDKHPEQHIQEVWDNAGSSLPLTLENYQEFMAWRTGYLNSKQQKN